MQTTNRRPTSLISSLVKCLGLYVILSYLILGGCFYYCDSKDKQENEDFRLSNVKEKFTSVLSGDLETKQALLAGERAVKNYGKYKSLAQRCKNDFWIAPLILPKILQDLNAIE